MNNMERVPSSAMKSLAAYAGSDDDEDERYEREEKGSGCEYSSSGDDYAIQKVNPAERHRTLSNVEIATSQLPEAPDSSGDEEEHHDPSGQQVGRRSSAKWTIEDEDNNITVEGGMGGGDDEVQSDDAGLVEPPPPARPRLLHSPSPSSSRGSTPLPAKFPRSSVMPRLPSSQALVAYDGAEDDDEHQHPRRSLESGEQKEQPTNEQLHQEEIVEGGVDGDGSRPSSVRSIKSVKSETTDEIDVDELLERPLEAGAGMGSNSTRTDTRGDAISIENIQIPPPPAEKCSEELQTRFRQYLERKRKEGYDFNAHIQSRTDFRNPSIYDKLIEHFSIDELGTNFPKSVYDPHGFRASDYYDEIAKAQRQVMEKGADKEAKPKPVTLGAATEERKRKSKWDN